MLLRLDGLSFKLRDGGLRCLEFEPKSLEIGLKLLQLLFLTLEFVLRDN